MKMHICENCGKEHDGLYGSGRFCSAHCRRVWSGKHSAQNGNHKCNLPKTRKASYGSWRCDDCGIVFQTRKELYDHRSHHVHKCRFCGLIFESGSKLGNHILHCKLNPNYSKNKSKISSKTSLVHKGKRQSEE